MTSYLRAKLIEDQVELVAKSKPLAKEELLLLAAFFRAFDEEYEFWRDKHLASKYRETHPNLVDGWFDKWDTCLEEMEPRG